MTEKIIKRTIKNLKKKPLEYLGVEVKLNYEIRTLFATPVFITKKWLF